MKRKAIVYFVFGILLISMYIGCASYTQSAPKGTWRTSTTTFCPQDSTGKLVEFTFLNNEKIRLTVGTRTFTLDIERTYDFDENLLVAFNLPYSPKGEFSTTWKVLEGDYLFDVFEYSMVNPETKLRESQVILRFLENKGFITCNDGVFLEYLVLHPVD